MNFSRILPVAIGVIFGLTVAAAQAGDHKSGSYVGLSGMGVAISDVDFDNDRGALSLVNTAGFGVGYGVLLKGGHKFGALRAEVELGYRAVDVDDVSGKTHVSGDATALTAMINGAWDIDTGSAVTPYLSLGLGIIKVDGDLGYTGSSAQTKSFDGTAPAGQLGLGAAYALSHDLDLVGGYTLLGAPTGKTGQDEVIVIQSLQLGLNYNF